VGGAVRDTLLGLSVKDIDAATPLLPDEVIARCKAAGIRTVPTGIEHGTVTAVLEGGPVEITTLRHDVSTDGRRATVAFARIGAMMRHGAISPSTPCMPTRSTARFSTISAGWTIWPRGGCALSAMRLNASAKTTCVSCAISGFRRVLATVPM
jgi:hypothetical protein